LIGTGTQAANQRFDTVVAGQHDHGAITPGLDFQVYLQAVRLSATKVKIHSKDVKLMVACQSRKQLAG